MLPEYAWTIGPQTYTLKLTLKGELQLQQRLGVSLDAMPLSGADGRKLTWIVGLLAIGLQHGWKPSATPAEIDAVIRSAVLPMPELALDIDGARYPLIFTLDEQLKIEQHLGRGLYELLTSNVTTGATEVVAVLGAALMRGSPKVQTDDDVQELLDSVSHSVRQQKFSTLLIDVKLSNIALEQAFNGFLNVLLSTTDDAWAELNERLERLQRGGTTAAPLSVPASAGAISVPSA